MLPTPEAASTAYAEVQSFINFFVREQGEPALRLLFADLKGIASDDPSGALRSVSGYDLSAWNARWQRSLMSSNHGLVAAAASGPPPRGYDPRDLARRARLGDLLLQTGYGAETALTVGPGVSGSEPVYRARAARAELARKDPVQAAARLGVEAEIDDLYGPWFGLRGRLLEKTDPKAAARAFELGLSADPLSEEVACEGRFSVGSGPDDPQLPADPAVRALCEAARKLPRD
jgi:hypothetical protein